MKADPDAEPEFYEAGCKYCGDDRRPRKGDACIDCIDPSEWLSGTQVHSGWVGW